MKIALLAAKCTAAAILLYAAYLAIRIGTADVFANRATAEGLEQAVRLEPGNAEYHRWLGVALLAKNPERSEREFRVAIRLNPWDADARMRLAFMHESQGKVAQAERELLETTKWDATFLPRWSLANFEFRHERMEEFWKWASAAVPMSYGDRTPLFDLAAATGEKHIAGRLGLDKVSKDEVWAAYLWWALEKAPAEEIHEAGLRVAATKKPGGPQLAAACDRLLNLGAVASGLEVWNAGVKAGVLPAGEAGWGKVTDGAFTAAPSGSGMDWAVTKPAGGFVARLGPQGGLRIHFNGEQCEQCWVLAQRIAVHPGATYRMRSKYKTQDMNRKSGLRWTVSTAKSPLASTPEWLWADDGGVAEMEFRVPDTVDWVRLELSHRRPEGQVRMEGTLLLEGVEFEALPATRP